MHVLEYSLKIILAITNYQNSKKKKKYVLQAIVIKVKMRTYELTVAAVYCPPRHNTKEDNFYEFL
jgi:hypothetical protein